MNPKNNTSTQATTLIVNLRVKLRQLVQQFNVLQTTKIRAQRCVRERSDDEVAQMVAYEKQRPLNTAVDQSAALNNLITCIDVIRNEIDKLKALPDRDYAIDDRFDIRSY